MEMTKRFYEVLIQALMSTGLTRRMAINLFKLAMDEQLNESDD